jgi:hypothetical protein
VTSGYYLEYRGACYVVDTTEMKVGRLGPRGSCSDVDSRLAAVVLRKGSHIAETEAMVRAEADFPAEEQAQSAPSIFSRLVTAYKSANAPERNAALAIGGLFGAAALFSLLINSGLGFLGETLMFLAVLPVLTFGLASLVFAAAGAAFGLLWLTDRATRATGLGSIYQRR